MHGPLAEGVHYATGRVWQVCLNEEHTGRDYSTAMVTVLLRNPCSFT